MGYRVIGGFMVSDVFPAFLKLIFRNGEGKYFMQTQDQESGKAAFREVIIIGSGRTSRLILLNAPLPEEYGEGSEIIYGLAKDRKEILCGPASALSQAMGVGAVDRQSA